jgi:hypothetical protein
MKKRILLPLLFIAAVGSSQAALMYSGVQNVPIPVSPPLVGLEGVYLRLSDGAVTSSFPADWSTAPWINPFFGGTDIASSDFLRPVITGADRVLNLAVGTVVDGTGNFASGANGSSTHIGAAVDQFQMGTPGVIGVAFKTALAGPDYYGWIRMMANNTGTGSIVDWAYETTPGIGVQAGVVPEPASAAVALLLALPLACLLARSRRSVAAR